MFSNIGQPNAEKVSKKTFLRNFGEDCLKRIRKIEAQFDCIELSPYEPVQQMFLRVRNTLDAYQILAYEIYDSCQAVDLSALGHSILKMYLQMTSMIKWTFKNARCNISQPNGSSRASSKTNSFRINPKDQFRKRQITKFHLQNVMRDIKDQYDQLMTEQVPEDPQTHYGYCIKNLQKSKSEAMAINPSDAINILQETVQSLCKKSQYIQKFIVLRENYEQSIRYENALTNHSKVESQLASKNKQAMKKLKKVIKNFMEEYQRSRLKPTADRATQTFLYRDQRKSTSPSSKAHNNPKQELQKQKILNSKLKKQLQIYQNKMTQLMKTATHSQFNQTRSNLNSTNRKHILLNHSKQRMADHKKEAVGDVSKQSADAEAEQEKSAQNESEINIYQEDDQYCGLRMTDRNSSRFKSMRRKGSMQMKSNGNYVLGLEKKLIEVQIYPSIQRQHKQISSSGLSLYRKPSSQEPSFTNSEGIIQFQMKEQNHQTDIQQSRQRLQLKVFEIKIHNENLMSYQYVANNAGNIEERVSKSIKIFEFQHSKKYFEDEVIQRRKSRQERKSEILQDLSEKPLMLSLDKKQCNKYKTIQSNFFKQSRRGSIIHHDSTVRRPLPQTNFCEDAKSDERSRSVSSHKSEIQIKTVQPIEVQKIIITFEPTTNLLKEFFINEDNAKNYQLLTISELRRPRKRMVFQHSRTKGSLLKKVSDQKLKLQQKRSPQIHECPEAKCSSILINKIYMQFLYQKKKNKKQYQRMNLFLKYPFSSVYRHRDKQWRKNAEEEPELSHQDASICIRRLWGLHGKCEPFIKEPCQHTDPLCKHQNFILNLFGIDLLDKKEIE